MHALLGRQLGIHAPVIMMIDELPNIADEHVIGSEQRRARVKHLIMTAYACSCSPDMDPLYLHADICKHEHTALQPALYLMQHMQKCS